MTSSVEQQEQEQPRVTFSAETPKKEVDTPPPSPTEQLDSEEPVLASETESSIAAAVTRLASETDDHADSDDLSTMGDDEEVETHRLMMKKEVHKKTMIGPDGKEQTTVMEDSQIQQENEPPEELRV